MLLTSLAGVLIASHAALLLLEEPLGFDAVKWVAANQAALNGVAVALIVLGILLQAIAAPDEEAKAAAVEEQKKDPHDTHHAPSATPKKPRAWWWKLLGTGIIRLGPITSVACDPGRWRSR